MWDKVFPVIWLVILVLTVIGLVVVALQSFDNECAQTGKNLGLTVQWKPLGGCFVELDGQMMTLDDWALIQIQKAAEH